MDDEAIYLLTSNVAYRIVPGQEPRQMPLDLGIGPALTTSNILFWSNGAIYQVPKSGGKRNKVGSVAHQPQYFVTSGTHFAWIDRSEEGVFTLQVLENNKPRVFYTATGSVEAMTMHHDWVFFVERAANATYRFGGVSIAGGHPVFTTPRAGRTPAMLTIEQDIYYYDGNTQTIRTLSLDFQREETIIREFICSPIAVADNVYCGRVEGLFELGKHAPTPRLLADVGRFSITTLTANASRVVWLSDLGPNKLALQMLSRN
jgi:hypothetical protein